MTLIAISILATIGCTKAEPEPAEPYTDVVFDETRISSDTAAEDFQNIYADFDFHDGPFEEVLFIADLSTTCFPFEQWDDNPPPAGQNWPASCDAFDRNFEFTMDEPVADGDPPALEIVRAITPFGGPMHIEVDITDLANGKPGAHQLHAHITSWSDGAGLVSGSAGGWNISASIQATPGTPRDNMLAVVPLFNGNVTTESTPEEFTFELPDHTEDWRIEYRVTGHGGASDSSFSCIGPAEEFCRRHHHAFMDGTEFDDFVPWRDDCELGCTTTSGGPFGSYCAENPCGHPDSVRAPRANWCPGSVTPAIVWDEHDLDLEPGSHTINFVVDDMVPGGSWRTSVAFYASGDLPEE